MNKSRIDHELHGLDFLAGGGEMGKRIRAFDWSQTPIGPPEQWPQSLKTAVRIMLSSRQAFWVGWGPDVPYIYNDPYTSILWARSSSSACRCRRPSCRLHHHRHRGGRR